MKQLLEKKIEKSKDIIEIKLNYINIQKRTEKEISILFMLMFSLIKYRNIKIGKYYFLENNIFIDMENRKIEKKSKILKILEKGVFKTGKLDHYYVKILKTFLFLSEEEQSKIESILNKIELEREISTNLTKENIIYMKDETFHNIEFEMEKKNKIDSIPLKRFQLIFELYRDKPYVFRASVDKIDKSNVDIKLNNIYDKYIELRDIYDEVYDEIYSGDKEYYILELNIKKVTSTDKTTHLFITSNDDLMRYIKMKDKREKKIYKIIIERLKFISEYFNNYSNNNMEKNTGARLNHFKVKERKSSLVKSHLRYYNNGTISKVRAHFRKGINTNSDNLYIEI